MIHGLLSTPLVWASVNNDLWADDAILRDADAPLVIPHRGESQRSEITVERELRGRQYPHVQEPLQLLHLGAEATLTQNRQSETLGPLLGGFLRFCSAGGDCL